MYTTIKVSRELKTILDKMKISPSESYEDVIQDLIEDHLELNPEFKKGLEEALEEVRRGKLVDLGEALKELEED
jgi:predicted transcriptional regulator